MVDYQRLETEVLNETNKLRSNPSAYISFLESELKQFKGDVLMRSDEDPIQTQEGPKAYKEAIEYLRRLKPMNKLEHDEDLAQACLDHAEDIGGKGLTAHEGSDGSDVSERIERYVEWDGCCFENIDFGSSKARSIVVDFLVDDGIPERGHRLAILSPDVKYIGIAAARHKEFGHCCVIAFVGDLRDKGSEAPAVSKSIFDLAPKKEKDIKNPFQETDPEAPDDTVSIRMIKTTKMVGGRPKKITKKIYQLADGSSHIVELFEK